MTNEEYIELARNFLVTMDAHGDIFSLMTDDVEFVMPKWGVARGKANLGPFFQALGSFVASIYHRPETFQFMVGDAKVCIEGYSEGKLQNGKEWKPDGALGGRFAVIYDFDGSLIKRVSIYIDPDYANETADYYPWNQAKAA